MRHRIPLAISLAALFFSLTGAGLAASGYRITSLWQISPKVRHELRRHQGVPGPQGPAGMQGAAGPQGPAGLPGLIDWNQTYLRIGGQSCCGIAGQALTISQPVAQLVQSCDRGDHVITGGFEGHNDIVTTSQPVASFPWEWEVDGHLDPNAPPDANGRPASGFLEIWVLCARADTGS